MKQVPLTSTVSLIQVAIDNICTIKEVKLAQKPCHVDILANIATIISIACSIICIIYSR